MPVPVNRYKYLFMLMPVLLFFACSNQNTSLELSETRLETLPKWTWPIIQEEYFKRNYNFNLQINPFYLQADFDKDGFADIALQIEARETGKKGIAILLNKDNQLSLFGAGKKNSYGGDNWDWLQTWKTEAVLPGGSGVSSAGTVLILFPKNKQQNAPWLFWTGNSWQWKTD